MITCVITQYPERITGDLNIQRELPIFKLLRQIHSNSKVQRVSCAHHPLAARLLDRHLRISGRLTSHIPKQILLAVKRMHNVQDVCTVHFASQLFDRNPCQPINTNPKAHDFLGQRRAHHAHHHLQVGNMTPKVLVR